MASVTGGSSGLSNEKLVDTAFVELIVIEQKAIGVNEHLANAMANRWYRRPRIYRTFYLRRKVRKIIDNNRDELYQKVCIEFEYCSKVQEHGKKAVVALGLLDILFMFFGATGGLLTWTILSGFFDDLCECDKKKELRIKNS